MNKSDLNESMLFKIKNKGLCVLLDKNSEKSKVFCNQQDIEYGEINKHVWLDYYNENLRHNLTLDGGLDIIAIKQFDSCVKAIYYALNNREPEKWDWETEEQVDFITAFNAWYDDNKTIKGVINNNDILFLYGTDSKNKWSIGAKRIANGKWYIIN